MATIGIPVVLYRNERSEAVLQLHLKGKADMLNYCIDSYKNISSETETFRRFFKNPAKP